MSGTQNSSETPLLPKSGALVEQILKSVRVLLGRWGYEAMTMRQVATATGKSTGTVNYHFGSKRGLMLAVLDRELANLSDEEAVLINSAFNAFDLLSKKGDRFWLDMLSIAAADELVAQRMQTLSATRRRRTLARTH
jgi:AcrR family transcriptional regulator